MKTAKLELPEKLIPVFDGPASVEGGLGVRGAYGGRGSAKTRTFAKMTAVWGYRFAEAGTEGQILCGREFQNSLEESSMEEVKAAIRSEPFLAAYYEIGRQYIRSKNGLIHYTFAGLRHNVDSLKSRSRILLAWIDEAEPVTEESWRKLIPTLREEGAELWATWNPESKRSATNARFREDPPKGSKIVALNWRDNPWFPDVLNQTRLEDQEKRPHIYDHIWEGAYAEAFEGAYFAEHLRRAHDEGRIGRVARDPLLPIKAFWDIGGTGRMSDAVAIWVAQFVGREVRVLDYYEAQGQELSEHIGWLRARGYDACQCILPHDGGTHDKVYRVSFESSLRQAGFAVTVVPNQGAGAARKRIEEARRLFPSCWFHEETTAGGREALAWYHEKLDEQRGIGLGPEHDWASHGADAFGLMAIAHSQHQPGQKKPPPRRRKGWAA